MGRPHEADNMLHAMRGHKQKCEHCKFIDGYPRIHPWCAKYHVRPAEIAFTDAINTCREFWYDTKLATA